MITITDDWMLSDGVSERWNDRASQSCENIISERLCSPVGQSVYMGHFLPVGGAESYIVLEKAQVCSGTCVRRDKWKWLNDSFLSEWIQMFN